MADPSSVSEQALCAPLRAQQGKTNRGKTMHIKRNISRRIMEASDALTAKDNERLLYLLIQKLERMAMLIDELNDLIEETDDRTTSEALRSISGCGIINVIAKARSLSSALNRFSATLRTNELRHRLPPEALSD
jgi:hypothetical protein